MKFGKKLVSLAAATALVAGVGLAAAAPASAKAGKVGGSTTIAVSAATATQFQNAMVTLAITNGGKVAGRNLQFNVTSIGDGFVQHSGTLSFIKDGASVLDVSNPILGWPTDQPLSTATLAVTTPLGPDPVPVFNVKNFKSNTKVKVNKKKKTRTSTTIYRGNVHLSTIPVVADYLNGTLGTSFAPDANFGTIQTRVVVTAKCKNKACTR